MIVGAVAAAIFSRLPHQIGTIAFDTLRGQLYIYGATNETYSVYRALRA
jgi:hypothetical protein